MSNVGSKKTFKLSGEPSRVYKLDSICKGYFEAKARENYIYTIKKEKTLVKGTKKGYEVWRRKRTKKEMKSINRKRK